MKYKCPVCDYDELSRPPANHMICPRCKTQFGYDDFWETHEALRKKWIRRKIDAGLPALLAALRTWRAGQCGE